MERPNIQPHFPSSENMVGFLFLYTHCRVISFLSKFSPPPFLADIKQMTRVSLSPQRRSFGSGCSWREQISALSRQSNAVSVDCPIPVDQEESTEQHVAATTPPLNLHAYAHGTPPSPPHGHTHHVPRVIDHVPYRSRQSHGDLPHHWRESPPQVRMCGERKSG